MDAFDVTMIAIIGGLFVALVVAVVRDIRETLIEDDEEYWVD